MGTQSGTRLVLDAVRAYERGAWDEAVGLGQKIGLSTAGLPTAYASALQWAQPVARLLGQGAA